MATYNLGQAAIVSKGAYNSGTSYVPLNAISHKGGAFLCKQACTAIEPTVTSGWETYWLNIASGIKTYSITNNSGTATVSITFTDGSTYSTTYPITAVAANSVNTAQLVDGAVATAKLGPNSVTEAKVANINTTGHLWQVYVTSTVPTGSSPAGIYLVYE